jgi:hypothetical protein
VLEIDLYYWNDLKLLIRIATYRNLYIRTPILLKLKLKWFVKCYVLTTMVIKYAIVWFIKMCSPLKINLHFGGKKRLHLQGLRISLARNRRVSCWFLARFILRPWRWSRTVPLKCTLTFNGLQGFQSQKVGLWIFIYKLSVPALCLY